MAFAPSSPTELFAKSISYKTKLNLSYFIKLHTLD